MESLDQAIARVFARELRDGYTLTAAHEYAMANGEPWNWRIRLDHPSKPKVVRPVKFMGTAYQFGEPPKPAEGKPLYRLPHIAANPSAPVWVVEGEKCADALAGLGLVATTSGSSSSAEAADWRPLAGRSAVVWPDNDEAGRGYAGAVKTALTAIGCGVEVLDVDRLGLLPKGDAADWLAERPTATAEAVSALPRCPSGAKAAGGLRGDPEPLDSVLLEGEEYPTAALGKVLGDAAKAIQLDTQAPAGIIGPSVLGAASLAVQAFANVRNGGRSDPLSLWFVTVAESGDRKSSVDSLALAAHRAVERDGKDAYDADRSAHEIELSVYEAEASKAKGSKDGLKDALTKLGPKPEPPLSPWLLVTEPTLEGLHRLLITGRPSVGLFNSDAGEFLGGHAMSKDNKTKTAAGLSVLWDSGEFSRVRGGDGASKYYGRRVALHLMVQPFLADGLFSDVALVGQGFLPRCLVAWPRSTIGTRFYTDYDASKTQEMRRFWAVMDGFLRQAPTLRDGTRNELEPRELVFSPDAMAAWRDAYNTIEAEMASNPARVGEYSEIGAWASKAAANVSRIAGVLALVENPTTGVIECSHVDDAALLVGWHLRETLRIVRYASDPPALRGAKALLRWLHETGRAHLYSSEALQLAPSCVRDRQAFMASAQILQQTGWIEPLEPGTVIDGRKRRQAWAVCPEGGKWAH